MVIIIVIIVAILERKFSRATLNNFQYHLLLPLLEVLLSKPVRILAFWSLNVREADREDRERERERVKNKAWSKATSCKDSLNCAHSHKMSAQERSFAGKVALITGIVIMS